MNKLIILYTLQFQIDEIEKLKREERVLHQKFSINESATKKKWMEWKRLQQKLKDFHSSEKEKELALKTQEEKCEAYQKQLYSNSSANAKALQELQHKIDQMKKYNSQLEEELVEQIGKREKLEAVFATLNADFERCKEEFKKEKAYYEFRTQKIHEELLTCQKEKERIRSSISPDLLFEFDNAFSRGQQRGVVTLENGVCSGCHTILSKHSLDSVRKDPDTIHYCENCSRILVITDD